ncbi:MAG: DUF4147 domain-containing protein [Candidatus Uhrbacteria bacterium]
MSKKHIIQNYQKLATTKLRKDALNIVEAGLQAINTKQVVNQAVKLKGSILKVQGQRYDLKKFNRVFIIGVGKASYDATKELERILGSKITGGIVIDLKPGKLKRLEYVQGTHPLPSAKNIQATKKIIELLNFCTSLDLIITIVSGGGSALLAQPVHLNSNHLIKINDYLLRSGASIHEINTVRKHFSLIKGGQFARFAHPATLVGLIFSDVPGDDLSVIASGPTVMDKTTVLDAQRIIKKYKIFDKCKVPYSELIETPKEKKYFKRVQNYLLVNNQVATEAMQRKAKELGYRVCLLSNELEGEASKVGADLAKQAKPGQALIAAGETTVTVRGKGKGGRNQELILGSIAKLPPDTLVCSVASDGIDNTPVAGAFIDEQVLESIKTRKLDPKTALKTNDSYPFFQKLECQIKTGKTGANVSDLMLVLRDRQA